ncbi:MAG: hypothetical protein JSR21_03715 [Proteobacteria bacterium]|nr:hypothetical protein [Pseudomonadota bacterium]
MRGLCRRGGCSWPSCGGFECEAEVERVREQRPGLRDAIDREEAQRGNWVW